MQEREKTFLAFTVPGKMYIGDWEKQIKTLKELSHTIISFYPGIETKNPYQKLLEKFLPETGQEIKQIFNQLLHALTLLQQVNRYRNRQGIYLSGREDVLATLQLMKTLLRPEQGLNQTERDFYRYLEKQFGQFSFTRKQAQQISCQSKSHTQRQIQKLLSLGLVEITGGHANKGYQYRIK